MLAWIILDIDLFQSTIRLQALLRALLSTLHPLRRATCAEKPGAGWIVGDRYKCAVCHDTDLCASCEALPINKHNQTHPLIKFRTPVRNVSVTTLGEKQSGETMLTMGDRAPRTSSKSTETVPAAPSMNAATQVQTVAEVVPSSPSKSCISEKEIVPTKPELQAHFVRDTLPDGSKLAPQAQARQLWVIRNPGPSTWPAGCSVKYVGGDGMLNVDNSHGGSIAEMVKATESNVCHHSVEVGQMVSFFVTIKAPKRTGKAISYWRLKAPDGTTFGHKLWCDIDVIEPSEVTISEPTESPLHEEVTDVNEEKVPLIEPVRESQMIFPTLEKESPALSIHEAEPEATVQANEDQDILEDLEEMELNELSSSDDGFLTDEEYELLDADMEQANNGKQN